MSSQDTYDIVSDMNEDVASPTLMSIIPNIFGLSPTKIESERGGLKMLSRSL